MPWPMKGAWLSKVNKSYWYSFGGATLFYFLVAMGSGIIMAQFNSPSPATAYAGVKYISSTAGIQLIRGVHYWAANLGFVIMTCFSFLPHLFMD